MKKIWALASAIAVTAGMLVGVAASPASASSAAPRSVAWGACRAYTEDQLDAERNGHDLAAFKRQVARRQCGTVSVPLDYRYPQGRQLRIAVTRYPALDQRKRLGVLAVNPGGPGNAGVLLPADLSLTKAGDLAKRFDLIGFDPRGIGDSTPRLACDPDSFRTELTTDPVEAHKVSVALAAANAACAQTDRPLAASLTTTNIARDMDRIRAGLGEHKLSYLGFSWGTGLGATYQTLFPGQVNRMVIDSPVNPDLKLDRWDDDTVAVRDTDSKRFIAWMASFNTTLGLGATPAEVSATLRRIGAFFTANPQPLPEIDNFGDEFTIPLTITNDSRDWPANAADLVAMNKIASAPPALSAATARHRVAVEPEFFNNGVNLAVTCNADTGIRDFDGWFARWEKRRTSFPVAGLTPVAVPFCAGWPNPGHPDPVSDTNSSVLVIGHQFEVVTPIRWAKLMTARIGADSLTVDDDVHASVVDGPCASRAVAYLVAGTKQHGHCAGIPLPVPSAGTAAPAGLRG